MLQLHSINLWKSCIAQPCNGEGRNGKASIWCYSFLQTNAVFVRPGRGRKTLNFHIMTTSERQLWKAKLLSTSVNKQEKKDLFFTLGGKVFPLHVYMQDFSFFSAFPIILVDREESWTLMWDSQLKNPRWRPGFSEVSSKATTDINRPESFFPSCWIEHCFLYLQMDPVGIRRSFKDTWLHRPHKNQYAAHSSIYCIYICKS